MKNKNIKKNYSFNDCNAFLETKMTGKIEMNNWRLLLMHICTKKKNLVNQSPNFTKINKKLEQKIYLNEKCPSN